MESGTPQDPSSGDSHMQKAHALVVCPEAGAGFRATASLALGYGPDPGLPGTSLIAGQLTHPEYIFSSRT